MIAGRGHIRPIVRPVIVVAGLKLAFDCARPVLDDVSLALAPRQIVSVVGESGAGKSSLLMCLCGILVPDAGSVEVDGAPLLGASIRDRDRIRRERFGFVFQSGALVPELSILENVSVPLRLLGRGHREAERSALGALEWLGIGELGGRMPTEVSGGELQRAAIARALIHEPSVVLADEPTGALDDDNSLVVLDLLIGHARETEAAVVLVTHDRMLAGRTDRVLELRDGSLTE